MKLKQWLKTSQKHQEKLSNDKLAELMKTLELPSDFRFTQDEVKPEHLFHQIDQVTEHCRNVVESAEL